MTEKKKVEEKTPETHANSRREAIKRLGIIGVAAAGAAAMAGGKSAMAAECPAGQSKKCYSRYGSSYMSTSVGPGSPRNSYFSFCECK
jgi:hypothetical protein